MGSGELFTDSTPRSYVEIGAGLLIDGKPAPSGVRVRLPADLVEYIIAQQWGIHAEGPHLGFLLNQKDAEKGRGVSIELRAPKAPPGVSLGLSEWSTHMRPLWLRAEGRVRRAELPAVFPCVCSRCGRTGYVRAGTRRTAQRGDAWFVRCGKCAQPTHVE